MQWPRRWQWTSRSVCWGQVECPNIPIFLPACEDMRRPQTSHHGAWSAFLLRLLLEKRTDIILTESNNIFFKYNYIMVTDILSGISITFECLSYALSIMKLYTVHTRKHHFLTICDLHLWPRTLSNYHVHTLVCW